MCIFRPFDLYKCNGVQKSKIISDCHFLVTDPVLLSHLCAGMEHLVKELSLLLKLLENESVSSATAEKMSVVRNLVKQLQPSGEIEQQIYNSWAEPIGHGPTERIHMLIIIAV